MKKNKLLKKSIIGIVIGLLLATSVYAITLTGIKFAGVKFTTVENSIGNPGEAGFGVGVFPSFETMVPNFTPMPGYTLNTHDNYGNYQYQDDSIMVWIPKFYYRIGHVNNPTYGVYGVNSIDVKGLTRYMSEATANKDGYTLHRAFIDGGSIKDGFFFDKYMCSNNSGIASSIKNGDPISTHAAHNPIAGLDACDVNKYWETIDAAHGRASIFHVASRFQYSALAILSMTHGQASSDTTYCAWYDAIYNYPKGCNNDSLSDVDDGTISYVSDGYEQCGKTGSGTPFAKTTHNGQNCGVADLNGLMYEVSIGFTSITVDDTIEDISRADPAVVTETGHTKSTGDYMLITGIGGGDWAGLTYKIYKVTKINVNTYSLDDVDTSGFTLAYDQGTNHGTTVNGTFYIAKEATAMKDFTSSNVGPTDHWGAVGVAAMMDSFVLALETEYAINGVVQRYGSGENQVLAEDLVGADWLLTGLGVPKDKEGIDFTGTNLFGKDSFYQFLRNEVYARSCGRWSHMSHAGIWHFSWAHDWTYSDSSVGFRCSTYGD